MSRISKYQYYFNIAEAVAARSTCLRRQYGAVIVNGDEIIATGYNGAPRGEANCCDVGACWREENKVPHGERYEACRSVHAEQNAIISAARKDMLGATLFLVGIEDGKEIDAEPCEICRRMLVNAGISYVVTNSTNSCIKKLREKFCEKDEEDVSSAEPKRAYELNKHHNLEVVKNDDEEVVLSVELKQEYDRLLEKLENSKSASFIRQG